MIGGRLLTITVQYVGDRPYVEFTEGGVTYGFSRQSTREDIPRHLAERFKGDNFPQWSVKGIDEEVVAEKTKRMVEAIEPTPEPVVEEAPQITEESESFDETWTKAKMVEWCEANGVEIDARANKSTIIETVRASASSGGDE